MTPAALLRLRRRLDEESGILNITHVSSSFLLVEDNPDDEDFSIRAVRQAKIIDEMVIVRNGKEVLTLLFGMAVLPAVVLLDAMCNLSRPSSPNTLYYLNYPK